MPEKNPPEGRKQSRCSDIGRIGSGLLLVFMAFLFIFRNEAQSVIICKTIRKGMDTVPSISADRIDPARQGKLVHVNGKAVTDAVLADPVFGVSARALRLRREVKMYQWHEEAHRRTGNKPSSGTATVTSYSYSRVWSDHLISSSGFNQVSGHENPGTLPYQSMEQLASKVTLGAFIVPASALREIDGVQQHDGGLYLGDNPALPQIGDVRIRIDVVPPQEISVIARQSGNSLIPYQLPTGEEIFWLRQGLLTVKNMFHLSERPKIRKGWRVRAACFFALFIGLGMILKVLSVRVAVLPLVGNRVAAGVNRIALLSAGFFFLLTMSTAWISYRPLLGIALLVAAGTLAFLIKGEVLPSAL